MSTAMDPRQDSPRQKVPVGKKSEQKEEKMVEMGQSAGKLFAFTIDANTAQIVKLESLDASGVRHELSDEEKTSLAQEGATGGLEEFIEQAFEAGIASVLGGADKPGEAGESADEAALRHLLLTPLIANSPAGKLMRREVLSRAILGTLIQHATTTKAATATESSPAGGLQAERAAPARAN